MKRCNNTKNCANCVKVERRIQKIHLITEIDKDILFILDESEGNVAGPDQVVIDTFDI